MNDLTNVTHLSPPEPADIGSLMHDAKVAHYAWLHDEAERLYRAVLDLAPAHGDALHNLAVLMVVQRLRPLEALPLLEAALNADPTQAQYWLSYIDALIKAGLFDAARNVLPLARMQGVDENMIARLFEEWDASQLSTPAVKGVRWSPSSSASESVAAAPQRKPAATAPKVLAPSPGAREMQELVQLYSRGDYVRGERQALALVSRYPAGGTTWRMLGAIQQQLGKHAEALLARRRAVELLPDDVEALDSLGNALVSAGQAAEALAYFERALAVDPGDAQTRFNYGNALLAHKRFVQAEAQFRLVREISPGWANAHSNLAFALQAQLRFEEAAESYLNALAVAPDDATTLTNLGLVKEALGLDDEALGCLRQALAMRPEDPEAHRSYGAALHKLGKLSPAETAYRRALQLDPGWPKVLGELGQLLHQLGRLKEAETSLRQCLAAQPELASAYSNLGVTLAAQRKWDEAVLMLRAAVERKPEDVTAHVRLGGALDDSGDYEGAVAALKHGIEALPYAPKLHTSLGMCYTMRGRLDDGIACFRRALEIEPDFDAARSCMLFALSHNVTVGAQELRDEHRRYGDDLRRRLKAPVGKHENSKSAERALRVGFVSADFRKHALAQFFEPFIARFSQHPDFACYAYYNHAARDAITRRIDACFRAWRPVVALADDRLFQQIQEDQIDILFDLSGHTAGHRLPVFARKPAPVQVTWMGYPGSTGLQAMDYTFVDHFFLPSEAFSDQFTEKLVQLPLACPISSFEAAPGTAPAPVLRNGYVTFGSFNRVSKISPEVVRAWARVMRAVPDSRLLLAGMANDKEAERIIAWLMAEGVLRDRLSAHSRVPFDEYMQLHDAVDICLDTFPYTGGTTTNHALWMGVPTLTIAGDTFPSRQSAMMLDRNGLRNFIVADVDDMVAKAVFWSQHVEELNAIRFSLRKEMLATQTTQREIFVSGVATALRMRWRRWGDDREPAAFRVEYEDIGAQSPQQSPHLPGTA